jgi:hypothetical protein
VGWVLQNLEAQGPVAVTGTVALPGWSVSSQTALTNTVVMVKTSAGSFGGYMLFNNSSTAPAYIQVFDVAAAGSVTLGTTAPTYTFAIPIGSAANLELTCALPHTNGIAVAATATVTGNGAPSAALSGFLLYR